MTEIEEEKQRCAEVDKFIGSLLTDPNKPGSLATCKKYTLRGIATGKDIVYVCRRAEPTLIELADNPDPKDQWWRLEYTGNRQLPVKAEVCPL